MSVNEQDPVREQYEDYPYPPRNPEDEKNQLATTWLDDLAMINHYCYGGREDFRRRFRVLVAGGGTGDATIFLAHQLRNTDAEIVHVDISGPAIELARRRAFVKGLNNIRWVRESLLAAPELGLGTFDYINCSGVLHHLEDPERGLRALLRMLADDGALGIMLYAQYGRSGVYQVQSLMRLINEPRLDAATKIANTKDMLAALPATNWFKRGEELISDHKKMGDAGIFDLFLHSRDRAYTVGELYEWFEDRERLHLHLTSIGRGRSAYEPEMVAASIEPRLAEKIAVLPLRRRQEIAELLGGAVTTHCFFATRSGSTRARYGDADFVPGFHADETGAQLSEQVRGKQNLLVKYPAIGITARVWPGTYGGEILKHIDGRRSFGEIFSLIRAASGAGAPSDPQFFEDFKPLFDFLNGIDRILLRHPSVEPLAPG